MTGSPVFQFGPRAPSQVGYDLAAEVASGRYEVWLHDAAVAARAETVAAELSAQAVADYQQERDDLLAGHIDGWLPHHLPGADIQGWVRDQINVLDGLLGRGTVLG